MLHIIFGFDWPSGFRGEDVQGSHGQGKVREKSKKFKVREKSGNFIFGQGNLKFWQKSGKSQGILESKVRPYFSVMIITILNQ